MDTWLLRFSSENKRMRKKKIVVIVPSLTLGGAEKSLVKLVNCLHDYGFDMTVISFASGADLCAADVNPDINVVPLGGIPSSHPLLWYKLKRALGAIGPDLVVGWSTYANLVTILVSKMFGRWKVLVSERNYLPKLLGPENERSFLRRFLTRFAIKILYARADCVTANSEGSVNFLKSYIGNKSSYYCIPNMIDVDKALELSRELPSDIPDWPAGPRLLALGRLVHQKGFDVLMEAIAIVRKTKRWSLVVVGDGPQREVLQKQVRHLEIDKCISFLGERINPFPYYGWADIVIIPSRFEGFPNVLLEAMACGKAAIVSNCLTGPYEMTSQGKFAQLVPVDDAEVLAKEIMRLGDNKILRENLGQQAAVHVARKFDINVINPQIETLFRKILS